MENPFRSKFLDCYFFGTFNPPHLGHINLAKQVKNEFGFDKIIFMPAFLPPHKKTLDFSHRFNMLNLALSGTQDSCYMQVSDLESHLEPPSFSYKTVNYLYEHNGGVKIPFIIGYDAFIDIEKWKNPEILKEKLIFVVLKRHSGVQKEDILALSDRGFDFKIAETLDYFDVSSNEIREKIRQNQDTTGLLDNKVRKYIDEHKLYG